MHNSLIANVANGLSGRIRSIPTGYCVEMNENGLPFTLEIEQPHENILKVSAWLRSFAAPDRDRDWMMLAFFIGTINSNMTSGRMRWNERGEFGFQSKILFDIGDPEFALRSAVDRTCAHVQRFGPGLKEVRNGESADVVSIRILDCFRDRYEPSFVSNNSQEFSLIDRLTQTLNGTRERIPGGIALNLSGARIEVTANESGRFLVRVVGPQISIQADSWNTINFYPPLVNSNDCFGTVYLHELHQLASRFDLYFPKGQIPTERLLGACLQSTVRDVSCHTAGMRMVARGEDAMSALRFAYSSLQTS